MCVGVGHEYLCVCEGRLLWTREESLSDICAVEVLDLPIATGKSHLENLFIELATATGESLL